jgi:hypothetical protein
VQVRVSESLDLVDIVRRDQLARAGLREIGQSMPAFEVFAPECQIERVYSL